MWNHINDFIHEFTSLESTMFVYSLSFSFLLALAPALILLVYVITSLHLDPSLMVAIVSRFIPQDFIEPFLVFLTQKGFGSGWAVTWTLLLSLWLASRSFHGLAMISAAKEGMSKNKIAIRFKSIYLFALTIAVIALSLLASTFVPNHSKLIFIIVLFLGLTLIYKTISFHKRNIFYGIAGASFATISISLTATLFLNIVTTFTSYESIYGPLASLVVVLLSVYVIATILYMGFLMNIILNRRDLEHENKQIKSNRFLGWCTNTCFGKCTRTKNRTGNRSN